MIEVLDTNRTWDQVKADVPVGTRLKGTVKLVPPFGLFIDAGLGFVCLMLIPECGLGRGVQTADVFEAGQLVTGDVIRHNDREQQVMLSRRNIVA